MDFSMPDIDSLDFDELFNLDNGLQSPATQRNGQLVTANTSTTPGTNNHRQLRNPRSCDFCRGRKTACIMADNVPPCLTCKQRDLECVFSERTLRRKRARQTRAEESSGTQPRGVEPGNGSFTTGCINEDLSLESQRNDSWTQGIISSFNQDYDVAQNIFHVDSPISPSQVTSIGGKESGQAATQAHVQTRTANDIHNGSSPQLQRVAPALDPPHLSTSSTSTEMALDTEPDFMAFLLSDSGEADPYLVRRSEMCTVAPNMTFRCVSRDGETTSEGARNLDTTRPLVFMMGAHNSHDQYEPRLEDSVLNEFRRELNTVSDDMGVRLLKLHFKYIYPHFPVLSRSRMLGNDHDMLKVLHDLPIALRAAIFASASPFMVYDDVLSTILDQSYPSGQKFIRLAWTAVSHEIHTPHLSTLQACLLLLQRENNVRYIQGSPFQWSFMAWTVGLAQSLGLPTDCSTWRGIPAWEKRLRRRLWWATFVMDKWSMPTAGLASHINNNDYDVLPLTKVDFDTDHSTESTVLNGMVGNETDKSSFQKLVELTMILSDTFDAFYTVRASKVTAKDMAVSKSLADPIRAQLDTWHATWTASIALDRGTGFDRTRLDGSVSVTLAYHATKMLLFRALLRPLDNKPDIINEREQESVRKESEECCVEVVKFLENMQPGAWNAYWHKCEFFSQDRTLHSKLTISQSRQAILLSHHHS